VSVIKDIFTGGAEGIFKGLSDLIGTFKADPSEVLKLQAELARAQSELTGKIVAAESAAINAVNQTMQTEAKSEHWMQWTWRPAVGFTFCGTIVNNYILYPYFAEFGMMEIEIPEMVWLAMLTVLGAAAYTRGSEKIARLTGK